METQLWAFEVYMRKGKLLLALSAMQRALAIAGSSDPTAHGLVVRFALQAQDSSRPVRVEPCITACCMQCRLPFLQLHWQELLSDAPSISWM
jgi:hypothetical protein